MIRKAVLILAAVALPSLLSVSVEAGVAQAMPVFPGNVTCSNASGGPWSGAITFTPPLKNGGTATTETFKVVAKLGSSTNPCVTSTTNPGHVVGLIKGKLKFTTSGGANACTTIFSGSALSAPVGAISKFTLKWLLPAGAPTHWVHTAPFVVTGALAQNQITVTGGTVATASFAPYPTPNATLSGAGWPATVTAGCASAAGLSSLTLNQSAGTW
jgi:hypothetical protein